MATGAFRVSLARHLLTGAVLGTPRLQRWLGGLESAWLRDRLEWISVERPVWIAGLARAGSTVLLEVLASVPGVATHQYRDFPFLHTPWWWRGFLERARQHEPEPRERAHGDRLLVTPRSPEAMEEILWMSFFDGFHDPARSAVLGRQAQNPRFERFFRDHIRKLLLAQDAGRYVSKANYNLTRLPYLHTLFPDARFVVPVRAPEAHVASLAKQHDLFLRAAETHPRSVAHLDRVGHFEFGRNRTPVNAGDDEAVADILEDWDQGREVRGWARSWAHLYGWLDRTLARDAALREATLVVRYEELCDRTEPVLRRVLDHTGLADGPDADGVVEAFVDTISRPTYYEPDFTPSERRAIRQETDAVARALGYDPDGSGAANHDGSPVDAPPTSPADTPINTRRREIP